MRSCGDRMFLFTYHGVTWSIEFAVPRSRRFARSQIAGFSGIERGRRQCRRTAPGILHGCRCDRDRRVHGRKARKGRKRAREEYARGAQARRRHSARRVSRPLWAAVPCSQIPVSVSNDMSLMVMLLSWLLRILQMAHDANGPPNSCTSRIRRWRSRATLRDLFVAL